MVIGPGDQPTRAEGEAFLATWPRVLERRLSWFQGQVSGEVTLDGSTTSLEPALAWVAARVDAAGQVDEPPSWFGPAFAEAGWTAYGAALVEGLTAYLDSIYRRLAGAAADWELDEDPESPYLHRPVPRDRRVPPAWVQVRTAQGKVRRGAPPDRLRVTAEEVAARLRSAEPSSSPRASSGEDTVWVSLAPAGRQQWQASLPEDVDRRLGSSYPRLEEALSAVEGVRRAVMEDRDSVLVTAEKGVDQLELERRLAAAVAGLAALPE